MSFPSFYYHTFCSKSKLYAHENCWSIVNHEKNNWTFQISNITGSVWCVYGYYKSKEIIKRSLEIYDIDENRDWNRVIYNVAIGNFNKRDPESERFPRYFYKLNSKNTIFERTEENYWLIYSDSSRKPHIRIEYIFNNTWLVTTCKKITFYEFGSNGQWQNIFENISSN